MRREMHFPFNFERFLCLVPFEIERLTELLNGPDKKFRSTEPGGCSCKVFAMLFYVGKSAVHVAGFLRASLAPRKLYFHFLSH